MFEQVRYVNHLNEPLYFGEDHLYVNMNTLHDYEWDIISQHEKIFGMERTVHTKDFPVRIAAVTEAEGIAKRNALFEIPEKDVLEMSPGRLIINGYYLPCYVTGSAKSYYSMDGRFLSCDMTVTTDKPFWIKEIPVPVEDGGYFEHQINNPTAFSSNFKIKIYGTVTEPKLTIGGHTYTVNVTIPQNQFLVIDSLYKTVYITNADEDYAENVFNKRGRDAYIFEKIKPGISEVYTNSNFAYDIMVYDERSEPAWIESETQEANWIYTLSNQHVFETTYTYVRPSGYYFTVDTNGHLFLESSEITKVKNSFSLENGRLIAYHD